MSRYLLPLESPEAGDSDTCGNKAAALSIIINRGLAVPPGFCLTTDAYRRFVEYNRLAGTVIMETARKPLDQMRWEEMWDASLRISNAFMRGTFPDDLLGSLEDGLKGWMNGRVLVARSSSLLEDRSGGSFAGLHESVINIRDFDGLKEAVTGVWASLWSDAVLAYSRELGVEEKDSAMAVVIQEMIEGESSGVAFGRNPNNPRQSVIEGVFGLNKALVDGDIQPDRWILERKTGSVVSVEPSPERLRLVAGRRGTRFEKVEGESRNSLPLAEEQVHEVFQAVMKSEEIFGCPQDMEWTIREGSLYLLQSRPVTTGRISEGQDRRAFDLSLRKSFQTLKEMSGRIENELIPQMVSEAEQVAVPAPRSISDAELADEISRRNDFYRRWKKIYWDEFIPFAHGVRLFGKVYNDRMKPDNPYRFVDLLSASETLSIRRNRMLEEIAGQLGKAEDLQNLQVEDLDNETAELLENFITAFGSSSCEGSGCEDEKESLFRLARELAGVKRTDPSAEEELSGQTERQRLEDEFLESFEDDERGYARDLLEIARHSYRLRDDDNIYLGRFEKALAEAMAEARRRLGQRCPDDLSCSRPGEAARALRDPGYRIEPRPENEHEQADPSVKARQLRGQPAGSGIARGMARVATSSEDLFRVKRGEILVCDSIDPNMTFVIPLVAGIVERRGGMLVHGAIVAREYGLPCVTGVDNVTRAVRTGERLTVDGYDGLVIIHRD